jgi:hypothetical protein
MNIKSVRIPITILLVLVFLFDLVVLYNLWAYRPWKSIVDPNDGVVGRFKVVSIWTPFDLLTISLVIIFQIVLAYATYRSWTSKAKN